MSRRQQRRGDPAQPRQLLLYLELFRDAFAHASKRGVHDGRRANLPAVYVNHARDDAHELSRVSRVRHVPRGEFQDGRERRRVSARERRPQSAARADLLQHRRHNLRAPARQGGVERLAVSETTKRVIVRGESRATSAENPSVALRRLRIRPANEIVVTPSVQATRAPSTTAAANR